MERALIDRIFYCAIAGFVAGIFIHSFVLFGVAFSLLFVFLGVILASYLLLHRYRSFSILSFQSGEKNVALLCAVFLFAVGLGMVRFDIADRGAARGGLEAFLGTSVALEGIVVGEPDVRESVTRLVLLTQRDTGATKVLLTVPHEPSFLYGDRVVAEGELLRPRNFVDERTLREVDYVSHLGKEGIYYEMFQPKLSLFRHGEGHVVIKGLLAFKTSFVRNLNELLPEPHASLLAGLIVGAKQSLGKKLLDDFRTVGVIHIVVLSGYNITIIALFIEWLLSRLKKNLRLIIAALAMILFALMVGAGATVIRATVMALLVLLARGTGRIYDVTRALLVAGVIMLLHNPKILVFDTSFQLSFLATLGLIYVSPLIEPKVQWVTVKWHIREIVVATIATQIFVLPFLLYKTGVLSIVSLPVNLLILSAVPATMLLGFLAGLAGFLGSAFAAPFAFLSYALLAYDLAVVEWFRELSFASLSLPYFPLWLAVFWYAVYAVLFILWRKKQSTVPSKESLLS